MKIYGFDVYQFHPVLLPEFTCIRINVAYAKLGYVVLAVRIVKIVEKRNWVRTRLEGAKCEVLELVFLKKVCGTIDIQRNAPTHVQSHLGAS